MNMILICGSGPSVDEMSNFLRNTEKFVVQLFTHGLDMAEGVVSAMHPNLLIVNIANMMDSSYNVLSRILSEEPALKILAMGSANEYNSFKEKFRPGPEGGVPGQLPTPFQKKEGLAIICRAMGVPFADVKDVLGADNPGAAMNMAMGGMDMSAMGMPMGGMDMSAMGMPMGGMNAMGGMSPMGGMNPVGGMAAGGPDLSGLNLSGLGMPGMGSAGVSQQPSGNAKPTILVVDDNAMTLRSMKGLLEDDYNVMIANSGAKAFKMMERGIPNLILLDYEMPEMDGRQVMQSLKADPMLFNIPVIFLTGVNDREHISAALAMRPAGYLLKPVAKAKLLATIESTLDAEKKKPSQGMGSGDSGEVPFI